MTSQVLPKEVRLTAPPTMPQARSYLFKQQSTQSSYSPGSGNIQINIPRLQRSYLSKDSYLKFRLGLSWANTGVDKNMIPCFDTCGAFGLFDTIEVYDYLGSTLLERTSGHGQLMALLMDTHCSVTEMKGHFGAASGCKGLTTSVDYDQYRASTATSTAAALQVALTWKNSVQPPVSGATFGTYIVDAAGTDPATAANIGPNNATVRYFEYTVPLFSFLGSLSKKYAPLHNGYTINITLNSAANALGFSTPTGTAGTGTAPTTYTLSEVYLCSQVLELGPVAESMLIASTQGQPFVVPTKAYRNYVGSVPGGAQSTTQYRMDLNLNVASLTNVMFIMRPSAHIGNIIAKTLSYRVRNYLQNWYFQYGSTILPQTTGIQCRQPTGATIDNGRGGYTEAYNELMKARHNYSNSNTMSMITADTYWVDTPTTHAAFYDDDNVNPATAVSAVALSPNAPLPPGKFAGGLDLELVPGRSNDLVCGMNTNGMNTSIFLNFDPTAVAASSLVAAQLDAWCEYDAFINISPGIATTVSF